MDSSEQYINSSSDQKQQHLSMKRTNSLSVANVFQDLTAKVDLYDHMKNTLQVSQLRIFD